MAKAKTSRSKPGPLGAVSVRRKAAVYCLFHYPTLYTAGAPKRSSSNSQLWHVPIVLSSPWHGLMGQVGEVILVNGEITKATSRGQVVASGQRLYQEKQHDGSSPTWSTKR